MRITSASGYGANTRQPFVALLIDDRKPIQMSPDDARSLARDLVEAAESAEQDGFLVSFCTDKLGTDLGRAGIILLEFRKWREERKAQ